MIKEEVGRLERQEREGQYRYRDLTELRDGLLQSVAELQEEMMLREAEAINEAQG